MSLEAIEERIIADARSEAERITREAQARAADIASHAADNGQRITTEMQAKAENDAGERRRRALGMADLEARKDLLREKRRLLDGVFETAVQRLTDLPADDYFALISAMIAGGAPAGDKELVLSEADAVRLPAGFMEIINRKLAEAGIAGEVRLSSEHRSMRGGFILKCGGVELNGTFERLITGMRSELEPGVTERLGFKSG
ncbi:MAG: V-type ATP synthase subunit E [bacterium]|nr:V-type ATP synthase subunit E [bacterium]